jgi:hypothetical protein
MKKLFVLLLTAALFTSTLSAAADTAPAISHVERILVAKINGVAGFSETIPLPGDRNLVTWSEERANGVFWLKTRLLDSKNRFSKVITLNKAAAHSPFYNDTAPRVVANKKGQLFAAWIKRTVKGTVTTDQILGRTSKNGTTWSKEFAVTKPLRVTGRNCEDFSTANCGYSDFKIAIDESGRLAVMVGSSSALRKIDFRVAATKNSAKWPNLKFLGTVRDQRESEIVGLAAGFAVSYMDYTGESCASRVALFNPKTSKWTNTLTAQNITINTVVYSRWIQRDANTLSIVFNSEIERGGIGIRNYNLKTNKWSGSVRTLVPSEEKVVFQRFEVAARGAAVMIAYTTYNQDSGVTQNRMVLLRSKTASPQTLPLDPSPDGAFPKLAGFRSSGIGVAVFYEYGNPTSLAQFTPAAAPMFIPGSSDNPFFPDISIGAKDMLYALELHGPENDLSLTLVKGKLN